MQGFGDWFRVKSRFACSEQDLYQHLYYLAAGMVNAGEYDIYLTTVKLLTSYAKQL